MKLCPCGVVLLPHNPYQGRCEDCWAEAQDFTSYRIHPTLIPSEIKELTKITNQIPTHGQPR